MIGNPWSNDAVCGPDEDQFCSNDIKKAMNANVMMDECSQESPCRGWVFAQKQMRVTSNEIPPMQ